MASLFISLVDQLAARHDSGRRHNAALDPVEQASRLFLIACDLMRAFSPRDLRTHLEDMMTRQWPEALQADAVLRGKTSATTVAAAAGGAVAPSSSPSASLPAASVPTLIAASGALVGFLWAHGDGDSPADQSTAAAAWVDDMRERWQSCVLQLLAANPPFSAEACTTACYTVGQLSLLVDGGCCDRVVRAACEALEAGREDGLTAVLATELLGQCTSLMVVCKPYQLRGAVLADPGVQHRLEQEAASKKQKKGSTAAAAQPGKKAKLSTQRPTMDGSTAAAGAASAASAGGTAESTTAAAGAESDAACVAIPSCYPFPSAERVADLKAELIECCLATLGASTASTSAPQQQQQQQQRRTVPTALICQRVLIPLLLLDGSEALEHYEALIYNLLHTLATRGELPATTSLVPRAAPTPDAVEEVAASALPSTSVNAENCDDVVLLIAALFDFLFRQPSLQPDTDFRFSPFLWEVLSGAMHRSLTATEMDAGHRANMQLRVEYLLKRIVYMTKEQQYQRAAAVAPPLPTVVAFHPLFQWCSTVAPATKDAVSATAWDNFFLVLESLNEYGWHIIEPVMARLDTLVQDLNTYLEACGSRPTTEAQEDTAAVTTGGALHSQWVEMLLLKLILHPNVGVRKVGLRRVWGLPPCVLQSLSPTFLFQYTFQSAADPRLCADLDRIPITASFLDTKAFEGAEVKAVPDIEPLAQEVERFYGSLFLSRWPADVAEGRVDALCRLLDTTLSKPPRFTVCVLARTLLAMGQVALDHHLNAEPIVLNEDVLQRLQRFMRDSVQENIPFWLDVRVTAILFAALTTFAAATPSPRRCRRHSSFWRLYCMCGPLGESGGHSITGMDACGQYGLVGASVDECFLQQWLVQLSSSQSSTLVAELLDVDTLEERVGHLVRGSPLPTPAPTVLLTAPPPLDVVAVKETFFLLGTLSRTRSSRDTQLLRSLAQTIAAAVASLQSRSYCTAAQLLSSAACVVELCHTAGQEVCAQLWPLRLALQSMSAALHTHTLSALGAALHALTHGSAGETWGALLAGHEAGSSSAKEEEVTWTLMQTTHFDVLAAAVASINAIACSDAAADAADVLGTPNHVGQLMEMLAQVSNLYERLQSTAAKSSSNQSSGDDTGNMGHEQRMAALLVVARNVYRLLQSELCGFLSWQRRAAEEAGGSTREQNGDASLHPSALPTNRESLAGATSRCPLAMQLPPPTVVAYLTQLMKLPAYRVPTGAVPSALSNMPWSTLLGQHGRYRCNILYVLALCLPVDAGAEAEHQPSWSEVEGVVAAMQDFALGQLEECWTMNLASVYDLLLWVASSNLPHIVDYVAIADGMWEHMREVGARQYTRLAALAFTVLHYVMPHHPDYVRDLLLRVLEGEGKEAQTADRDVYFAAMTASLQVLHNPAANWPVLREVLLYAAVLFNTNRDEEENESTVAVTESLLWSWPDALRLHYPPTTRMSAVGRAMAVSTLLWCCHGDVAGRALPLTMELLRMNVCHPVVTHEPCMPNSRTHRTRIRLWQLLCALLPSLAQAQQPVPRQHIEEVFRLLVFHCITVNNMGSVRRLMELYAIRLVEQHPGLYAVVSEALGNYSLRPQVCGTYILIACHALLRQEAEKDVNVADPAEAQAKDKMATDTFSALFPRILQQSTSNQHLLRIISHIGLVNICQRRIAQGKPLSAAVEAVYDYVLNAPEHVKFREKHAHMLFFDTDEASSPRNLFCVQRKEANTVLAEVLPAAAFERIRFVETEMCCMIGALYPMELLRVHDWCAALQVPTLVRVFSDFPLIPHTAAPCDYYVDYTQEATELLTRDPMTVEAGPGAAAGEGAVVDAATANVQKKVSSWWTSEVYNELHPRALRTQKQSIIVVGSLLENPVNIAGLCRCGEIFAVESIVVPEKKVFEHPHFVAAARSAELWIPWEEVMPKDLPGYLEGLRRRGYTIVGIEQTANSVSMEAFAFPERCAVVLGAEGQGVPAPLIPLLDVCVEIPQYGLIRSLNVHVTGAIAMYEYTRQHLMGKTHE